MKRFYGWTFFGKSEIVGVFRKFEFSQSLGGYMKNSDRAIVYYEIGVEDIVFWGKGFGKKGIMV